LQAFLATSTKNKEIIMLESEKVATEIKLNEFNPVEMQLFVLTKAIQELTKAITIQDKREQ